MWFMGVLFIRICGIECGRLPESVISRDHIGSGEPPTGCFRDGGYFERCPDDQNKVHTLPILFQCTVEVIGELLPEEGDVGLWEP